MMFMCFGVQTQHMDSDHWSGEDNAGSEDEECFEEDLDDDMLAQAMADLPSIDEGVTFGNYADHNDGDGDCDAGIEAKPKRAKQREAHSSSASSSGARKRPSASSGQCQNGSSSMFYMPDTVSTPVTSHFDALLECIDLLRHMEADQSVDKQDVVDSLRSLLHNMLSSVMMHSLATSMSVNGWFVE